MNDASPTPSPPFSRTSERSARKYISEEAELRLLVRFADEHGDRRTRISSRPSWLGQFLASRPRSQPRSFNHLVGVVGCMLDWAVTQRAAGGSPLQDPAAASDRDTDCRSSSIRPRPPAARRGGARFPDNSRAPHRGPTYRGDLRALLWARAAGGEACGLRVGDVDAERELLVVQGRQVRQEPPRPTRATDRRAARSAGRPSR